MSEELIAPKSPKNAEVLRKPGGQSFRAAVSGGSITGLIASLRLVQAGYEVDLFEKRAEYSRNIQWAARQNLIDTLAKIDEDLALKFLKSVATEVPKGTTFVASRSSLYSDGAFINKERPKTRKGDPSKADLPGAEMLEGKSTCLLRAQEFEKFLNQYAQNVDAITIHENTELPPLTLDEKTNAHIVIERLPYDLIVVAEGAASTTRQAVGINSFPVSRSLSQVAGSVEQSRSGMMIKNLHVEENEDEGREEYLLSGLISTERSANSWIVGDIPRRAANELEAETDIELQADIMRRCFKRVAARCMFNSERNVVDAGFEGSVNQGDIRVFSLQSNLSEAAFSGTNLVLIGDAVGNGHWSVGGGMQVAAVCHSARLGVLANAITNCVDGAALEDAFQKYSRGVLEDTQAWIIEGIQDFYLGLPEEMVKRAFKTTLATYRKGKGMSFPDEMLLAMRRECVPDSFGGSEI